MSLEFSLGPGASQFYLISCSSISFSIVLNFVCISLLNNYCLVCWLLNQFNCWSIWYLPKKNKHIHLAFQRNLRVYFQVIQSILCFREVIAFYPTSMFAVSPYLFIVIQWVIFSVLMSQEVKPWEDILLLLLVSCTKLNSKLQKRLLYATQNLHLLALLKALMAVSFYETPTLCVLFNTFEISSQD